MNFKYFLIVLLLPISLFIANNNKVFAYADCIHPENSTSYDEYQYICVQGNPGPYSPTPTPTPAPTGSPDIIAPSAPTNVQYFAGVNGYGDPLVSLSWDSNPEAGIKYYLFVDGIQYNYVPVNGLGMTYYGTDAHTFELASTDSSGNISTKSLAVVYSSGTTSPTPTPTPAPVVTPTPTPAPITVNDLNACVTTLCSCIQSLAPVLGQINDSTNGVITAISTQLLPQLQDINTKLADQLQLSQDIKNQLIQLTDQFKPIVDYPINNINQYPPLQLSDNKPPMRETVFTDNTTYFTDQGDDVVPAPFPVAPEPSDSWKDANGNLYSKQSPVTVQPVATKAPVIQKDTVKSPTVPLVREMPLPQDTTIYDLHWKSSEYQP